MGRLEQLARWILPVTAPGRVLAPRESLVLERAAEVLLAGTALDVPAADVARNVEEFLRRGRSRRAWRVRVLLTLIEVAPMSTHRRPFSRLTFEERCTLVRSKSRREAIYWNNLHLLTGPQRALRRGINKLADPLYRCTGIQ